MFRSLQWSRLDLCSASRIARMGGSLLFYLLAAAMLPAQTAATSSTGQKSSAVYIPITTDSSAARAHTELIQEFLRHRAEIRKAVARLPRDTTVGPGRKALQVMATLPELNAKTRRVAREALTAISNTRP